MKIAVHEFGHVYWHDNLDAAAASHLTNLIHCESTLEFV